MIFNAVLIFSLLFVCSECGSRRRVGQNPPPQKTQQVGSDGVFDEELKKAYNLCKDKPENKPSEEDMKCMTEKGCGNECPTSQGGKCLLTCMCNEAGLMQDNQFSSKKCQQKVKEKMPAYATLAKYFIDDCEKKVGKCSEKDRCEVGPKIAKCFSNIMKMKLKTD